MASGGTRAGWLRRHENMVLEKGRREGMEGEDKCSQVYRGVSERQAAPWNWREPGP